jgi:hypothetical protein
VGKLMASGVAVRIEEVEQNKIMIRILVIVVVVGQRINLGGRKIRTTCIITSTGKPVRIEGTSPIMERTLSGRAVSVGCVEDWHCCRPELVEEN